MVHLYNQSNKAVTPRNGSHFVLPQADSQTMGLIENQNVYVNVG